MAKDFVLGTVEYAYLSGVDTQIKVYQTPDPIFEPNVESVKTIQFIELILTYDLQDVNGNFITKQSRKYPIYESETLLDAKQILGLVQLKILDFIISNKEEFTGVQVSYE